MKKYDVSGLGKEGGFTLVETFVALTILLVAIVAPMTIAQRGLQSSFFAHERVMATYLAGEAVEVVRALRDTEMLAGEADWMEALPSECLSTNEEGCDFDVADEQFVDCAAADACILRFDASVSSTSPSAYLYHHDTTAGSPSIYTRQIWVEEIEAEVEAEVRVVVSWTSGLFSSGVRTVEVTDRLFNYDSSTSAGSSGGAPLGSWQWVWCADENDTCSVPGTNNVRYGEEVSGVEYYNQINDVTGSISCNNATFGDPITGTRKHCDYYVFVPD